MEGGKRIMKANKILVNNIVQKACLVLFCLLLCSTVQAADYAHEKGMATIGGKTLHAVLLDVHGFKSLYKNQILVTSSSIFYGPDGNMISFKDLKVPCHAEIEYKIKTAEGSPEVARVKIIEYDPDAKADFTFKSMEKVLPR